MICADSKETISAEELCVLTELSDRQHRNIAAAGNFPLPIDGKYQFWPTMRGLLKYYREKNTRTKEGAGDSKKRKTEVETKILEIKLAREERRSIERSEVNKLFLHVASQQKAVLFAALEREYPGKVVGRTASEISLAGRQLGDRLCAIFTREADQWQKQD